MDIKVYIYLVVILLLIFTFLTVFLGRKNVVIVLKELVVTDPEKN